MKPYYLLPTALFCLIAVSEVSAFSAVLPTERTRTNQPTHFQRSSTKPVPHGRSSARIALHATPTSSSPSPLSKLLSSPVGALLVLAGVICLHESGHYTAARALGVHPEEFSLGIGPKLLGFQAFGDAFSLRLLPVGGYVDISYEQLQTLSWQERVLILSAGVTFNLLLAFLVYVRQVLYGEGIARAVLDPGVVVTGTFGPEAAANGILREGDVIVAANGMPLRMSKSPSEAEAQRAISTLIRSVQSTPDGESVQFSVQRQSASTPSDVRVTPKRMPSQSATKSSQPSVGVFLAPNLVGIERLKSDSVLESAAIAFGYVFSQTKETANGLLTFAGDVIQGTTASSEYRISGPLRVIEMASQVVATEDIDLVLKYAAALCINLAVLNMFPLPPTDGFQIVSTLLNALRTSL